MILNLTNEKPTSEQFKKGVITHNADLVDLANIDRAKFIMNGNWLGVLDSNIELVQMVIKTFNSEYIFVDSTKKAEYDPDNYVIPKKPMLAWIEDYEFWSNKRLVEALQVNNIQPVVSVKNSKKEHQFFYYVEQIEDPSIKANEVILRNIDFLSYHTNYNKQHWELIANALKNCVVDDLRSNQFLQAKQAIQSELDLLKKLLNIRIGEVQYFSGNTKNKILQSINSLRKNIDSFTNDVWTMYLMSSLMISQYPNKS